MSTIQIVKGFPIKLNIGVLSGETPANVNDGTWTVVTELRYQTKKGPIAFPLVPIPNGLSVRIEMTSEQTSQLNHLGTGYILVVRASKIDQTTFLKTEIQVSVRDDL